MLELLIILVLGAVRSFGWQGSELCSGSSWCIPLSECQRINDMLQDDKSWDAAQKSLCAYFHEPWVCCDKNCFTPNGNYGQSVPLDACSHLKANAQSSDRRKRKFLAESYVTKTHVCCNEGEDSYSTKAPAPVGALRPSTAPKPLSSSCITPNGETATCRHINQCEVYKAAAAMQADPEFHFINDSFCGFWKEPMVCCGSVSGYKETYTNNLPDAQVCGEWDTLINPTIPPWLVLITSATKMCVGAVINQEYVLASAKCTGEDYKELNLRIGECINDESRNACRFQVKELKIFPLHTYLFTEDIGMVLLKLNKAIQKQDFIPVCLPVSELTVDQAIDVVGVERSGSTWKGVTSSTTTESNYSCRSAMNMYFERIVCIKDRSLCSNTKRSLLQSIVLGYKNGRWHLEGLFNKDGCYGTNRYYFNAIYVYAFVPWIKSNIN